LAYSLKYLFQTIVRNGDINKDNICLLYYEKLKQHHINKMVRITVLNV